VNPVIAERIRLEPLTAAHAAELYTALRDPDIYTFIPDQPPASLAALTERYRRLESRCSPDGSQQWLNWVVRRSEDRQCVGYIQATIHRASTADFAFVLAPSVWGLGLAREAASAVLPVLSSDYGATSIFATVDRRNQRSIGLLTRLGFQRVPAPSYPHDPVEESDDVFRYP
jgi:RimJ/RimL family protein N-acetyltransferase